VAALVVIHKSSEVALRLAVVSPVGAVITVVVVVAFVVVVVVVVFVVLLLVLLVLLLAGRRESGALARLQPARRHRRRLQARAGAHKPPCLPGS